MTSAAPSDRRSGYLPALHWRRLTPLYDPVLRWLFHENALRSRVVASADLRPGERVLDLGCGTGTLTIELKKAQPRATVIGLDGDPEILVMARRKAARAGVDVRWDLGTAWALPYRTAALDLAVASLMLHHLTPSDRGRALRDVSRVLRPGGRFLAADFGPPGSRLARALGKVSELLEETRDGVEGRLPDEFRAAGFDTVHEEGHLESPMGTIRIYRSMKQGGRIG